jgi:hypothetical protein
MNEHWKLKKNIMFVLQVNWNILELEFFVVATTCV